MTSGVAVPMPTLPALFIVIRNVPVSTLVVAAVKKSTWVADAIPPTSPPTATILAVDVVAPPNSENRIFDVV